MNEAAAAAHAKLASRAQQVLRISASSSLTSSVARSGPAIAFAFAASLTSRLKKAAVIPKARE